MCIIKEEMYLNMTVSLQTDNSHVMSSLYFQDYLFFSTLFRTMEIVLGIRGQHYCKIV